MSNNTQVLNPVAINPRGGGDVIATDDLGGYKAQRVKLMTGATGVDGGNVSSANPLPVSMSGAPLPTGAATEATLLTLTKPSDQQHVIIDSSASVPVTGTFWQATQPVSAAALPLPADAATQTTLALIKAKTDNIDVALSTRTKPADQQHVIVDSSASIAVTGPLTDAQLRNSAVPVSGPLTDAQLRATPVPVSTAAVSTVNSTTATLAAGATFTGTGDDVSIYPSVVVALKTDQAGTLYIEFSPDNTNWDSSLSFSVAAAVNEVHRLSVTRPLHEHISFTADLLPVAVHFRLSASTHVSTQQHRPV